MEMDKKWTRNNGQEIMDKKWTRNGQEMDKKWRKI